MFLKKQDLTRKKKQNFLLLRSTYFFWVFIQKKISGMSCTNLGGSGKGMYKRLLYAYLRETTTKKQVAKTGTEFSLFLTNP